MNLHRYPQSNTNNMIKFHLSEPHLLELHLLIQNFNYQVKLIPAD